MNRKTIEIVAGPNGSGKTTFAESFFTKTSGSSIFINPDAIAAGISPNQSEKAAFQAGRIMIEAVTRAIETGESFAFESTLSGKTWLPILRQAHTNGYRIKIYFIYLKNVQVNLRRIRQRVKQGGHSIPRDAVIRRLPRAFENFWNSYRLLCEDWFVFDNTGKKPKHIISKNDFDDLGAERQEAFSEHFLRGRPQ